MKKILLLPIGLGIIIISLLLLLILVPGKDESTKNSKLTNRQTK